jgi:hypothetical protein
MHYEVERKNESGIFQKIATVPASVAVTYQYHDVITGSPSYYYRVKSVDMDGMYQYSELIYLRRNSKAGMQVLGNPFKNQIDLRFTVTANNHAFIHLYDATGKLLKQEKVKLTAGQSVYVLKGLNGLPAGGYLIEAIMEDRIWRRKMVKN